MASKKPYEISGAKHKHLTEDQRMEIQECLLHGMNFKAIGQRIGKDQTTISKEVKKHIKVVPPRMKEGGMAEPCSKLLKPPYVCNACKLSHTCRLEKHLYQGRSAQTEYRETLVDSRSGIALDRETFYEDDAILKAGVDQGQHIYHIVATYPLHSSLATVYRYINAGYSQVSRIDLPRAVKFKPRRKYLAPGIPPECKKGRTYDCFLNFVADYEFREWLEMDTVIGRTGGKVLLTFTFTNGNFIFSRLCENKSAEAIASQIIALKARLRACGFRFGELFPLVLTDNGSEFANVSAVENNESGEQETKLFFCEPYHSSEKPHVEKNHTLLRDILPQGSSFDQLTQKDVDLVFSHVNAVRRMELHGKSSYDIFTFLFGDAAASSLGIAYIPPEDVVQSPKLLADR